MAVGTAHTQTPAAALVHPSGRRHASMFSSFKTFLKQYQKDPSSMPKAEYKRVDERGKRRARTVRNKEQARARWPTLNAEQRLAKRWEVPLRALTSPTSDGPTPAQIMAMTPVVEKDGSKMRTKAAIVRVYRKGLGPWKMREEIGSKYVHLSRPLGKDGTVHVHLDAFRVAFVNIPTDDDPRLHFGRPDSGKPMHQAARGVVAIHRKGRGLMLVPMIFLPSMRSIEMIRILPPILPNGRSVPDGSDMRPTKNLLRPYAPYKFNYARRGMHSLTLAIDLNAWFDEIGLHEEFCTDVINLLEWKRHAESVTWMRRLLRFFTGTS